jgi:hypothetical protein
LRRKTWAIIIISHYDFDLYTSHTNSNWWPNYTVMLCTLYKTQDLYHEQKDSNSIKLHITEVLITQIMSRLNNVWFNYGAHVFSWVVNNWMCQKSNKWHMLVVVKTFIMQVIARSHIGILKWKTPRTKVWIPQLQRKAGSSWSIPTPDWVLFQPKKQGPHSGGPRSRYSKSQGRVRVKVRSKKVHSKKLSMGGG